MNQLFAQLLLTNGCAAPRYYRFDNPLNLPHSPSATMEIPEILLQMEKDDGTFARAAVTEAVARRDEVVPSLLDILERVADDSDRFASGRDHMALIHAMFLLAQFREPRASPLLVRIFSSLGESDFDLIGDLVTEKLGSVLASVSNGDLSGMKALIESEQADEFVRSAAMRGLLTVVANDPSMRGQVMAYFASLFDMLERVPSYTWSALACACTDLGPEEVRESIRQAYEDGLVDPRVIRWKEIEEALQDGTKTARARLQRDRLPLVTDAAAEIEWWTCFEEELEPDDYLGSALAPSSDWSAWQQPIRRAGPKVGRNAPCPCGSGKKYKKCCGA